MFVCILKSHSRKINRLKLNFSLKIFPRKFLIVKQQVTLGFEIPVALLQSHRFVSTKSFVSLQLTQWGLQKLLENTSSFRYYVTNPLSMMPQFVEHFHSTTHVKNKLMSQFQYVREFKRSVKEALKRFHPWSAYYRTTLHKK